MINVQNKCQWGKKLSKELENMLMVSKNLDAQMLIFFSDNPIDILKDCIGRGNVEDIILTKNNSDLVNYAEKIQMKSNEIKIHVFD